MSQNPLALPTTGPLPGLTAISGINNACDSLARLLSGASAPTASALGLSDLKGVVWHDTANNLLKVRDQADSAWITLGSFDEVNKLFQPALKTDASLRQSAGGLSVNEAVTAISANQTITASSHFANFVATAALTITLPQASTLTNGACAFSVLAQGGAVTLAPNAADVLVVGATVQTAGASYVLAQGGSAFVVCDGAGKWYLLSLTVPAAAASAGAFRNRIINGDMRIDQRNAGAAQTITAGAALAYTLDRWYATCTGANVTGQQITTGTKRNRYQFSGGAGVTGIGFGQRIEAANSLDLAGQTCTLSFKAASSALTSLTWTAYYANSADNFGARTQIATGTVAITGTEAVCTASISVPAAAVTGIEIVFSGGALLAGQTLTIGDVQFETGASATTFEVLPFYAQLQRCQRYYQKTYDPDVIPGTVGAGGVLSLGYSNASGWSCGSWTYAVTMRCPPTITLFDTNNGAAGQLYTSGGSHISGVAQNVGKSGTLIFNTTSAGGGCVYAQAVANAEL